LDDETTDVLVSALLTAWVRLAEAAEALKSVLPRYCAVIGCEETVA